MKVIEKHVSLAGYEPTMTTDDAAKLLHRSRATIQKMCRSGELPSIRIGRRVYVLRDELERRINGGHYDA